MRHTAQGEYDYLIIDDFFGQEFHGESILSLHWLGITPDNGRLKMRGRLISMVFSPDFL